MIVVKIIYDHITTSTTNGTSTGTVLDMNCLLMLRLPGTWYVLVSNTTSAPYGSDTGSYYWN